MVGSSDRVGEIPCRWVVHFRRCRLGKSNGSNWSRGVGGARRRRLWPCGRGLFTGRRRAEQHCHRATGLDHPVDRRQVEAAGGTTACSMKRARKLGDWDIERVLALTLKSRPDDATHWSTRSMAAKTGFSRASIHRIWRAFALASATTLGDLQISRNPLFIDKVHDIVGLYLNSPERALAMCVYEKSQIQALAPPRPAVADIGGGVWVRAIWQAVASCRVSGCDGAGGSVGRAGGADRAALSRHGQGPSSGRGGADAADLLPSAVVQLVRSWG